MPKETYDRPRGIDFGVDRVFRLVVLPWFYGKSRQRELTAEDAELIVTICLHPDTLPIPAFDFGARLSRMLAKNPAEVGELIARVGKWIAKQNRSQAGRARRLIEIAMTRGEYRDLALDPKLLEKIAGREGIKFRDVSPVDLKRVVFEIRREVEEMNRDTPKATNAQIDQLLAKQKSSVQKKPKK